MSLSAFKIPPRRLIPKIGIEEPPTPLSAVSTAAEAEAAWMLWGRGTANSFDGKPKDDFSMAGDVVTSYLGLDYRVQPNVLVGLAVPHSQGDMDYETRDVTKGDVDITLTSVSRVRAGVHDRGWGLPGAG